MKILLTIIIAILLQISESGAQVETDDLIKDSILSKLNLSLPKGWFMYSNEEELIIENKDSVWVLFENKINAPLNMMSNDEKIANIKKYGKSEKSKIIFKLEKKWQNTKLKIAVEKNKLLSDKISKLPEKYNIQHLINKPNKNNSFLGNTITPPERKRFEKYETEKKKLEKEYLIIPDYHSEKYSMFLKSIVGREDEFNTVYPSEHSIEIYQIEQTIKEICK